jgi:dTDP-4-dehydrorhamnose reductase
MLRLGKERSELGVIGDQFGGPTYSGDIASALISIMDKFESTEQSGVYHYAGEPHVSWYQFATSIFEAAAERGVLKTLPVVNQITTTQYPLPAPRPVNSRLDNTKIKRAFDLNPSDWVQVLRYSIERYT